MGIFIPIVVTLLSSLLPPSTATPLECQKYILQLNYKFMNNKTAFTEEMLPYMFLSGKGLNDLGLPSQCLKKQTFSFSTVQINLNEQDSIHATYYGFCFTNICSAEDLNAYGDIIIDDIFDKQLKDVVSINFVQPSFETSSSVVAILLYVGFAGLICFGLVHSLKKWRNQCRSLEQDEQQTEQDINLSSRYEIRLDDDYEPQLVEEPLELRLSLEKKFYELQQPEESEKIVSFSCFKIIAVPWIIFGQLFYLSNFAAYNYFSFESEIYSAFYAKLAVAAYYLPDIFFFISAFLLTDRLLNYEINKESLFPFTLKLLKKRFLKAYPLYITIVLIYWFISPTLHSGPVWYVYEEQASVCNYSWWRVILLIDNWFTQGCYSPGWFVPVYLQLMLLNTLLVICYFKNTRLGGALIALTTLVFWILLFVISGPLPSSVDTMISSEAEHYFKSTYSHAPFYLMGLLFAMSKNNQSFSSTLKNSILSKRAILSLVRCFGFAMIILIISRPSLWEGVLGFELALCRTGFFLSMLPFFLIGMYIPEKKETTLHKYAQLTYPVILCSGIVTLSSFWGYETFPFVSSKDLFTSLIPSFFISAAFGGFMGLLISFKRPVYK